MASYNVSGSEISASAEIRHGYRGILDQSIGETSASLEEANDSWGQAVTEHQYSYELGCVSGIYNVSATENSVSIEYKSSTRHPYLPPDGGGIGSQPGYDFGVIYNVYGVEFSISKESLTLSRNGVNIPQQIVCKPIALAFYNPLTEDQYNLLNEEDYSLMEE